MAGAQQVFNGPVSQTYASTASNALGAPGGTLRIDTAAGKEYRLVKAGVSIAHGAPVQVDTAAANASNGTIVEVATASTFPVYGVMNCGTATTNTVAANGYFWCQVGGVATIASQFLDTDNVGAINAMVQLNSDVRIASKGTATLKQDIIAFGQALNSWDTDATHVVSVLLAGNVGK